MSSEKTQEATKSYKLPETKYFSIDLGHKNVNIRKWKAKDRNAFKKLVESDNSNIENKILQILVTNCLEDKKVPLSFDELQYLFVKIRALSISDDFTYTYICSKCKNENIKKLKISDVIKFSSSEYKPIEMEGIKIEIQTPPNADFYNKKINSQDYNESYELALCTKSINDNITMNFNEIIEYYEDLETDIYDKIMEEFDKMRFKLLNKKTFTCNHTITDSETNEKTKCNHKLTVEFDEIPDFFPESWLKR